MGSAKFSEEEQFQVPATEGGSDSTGIKEAYLVSIGTRIGARGRCREWTVRVGFGMVEYWVKLG